MEKPRSAASISKWGAACAPCATAKAKCLRSNEAPGAKCDRCQNLEKDCTDQIHKPRKKRQSKPSKTARLEEKLNSLVDLLKAPGEIPPILAGPSDRSTEATGSQHRPMVSGKTPDQSQSSKHDLILNDLPSRHDSFAPPTCISRAPVSEEDLHPADSDENLLSIYMNQLCSWFPFVIISPGTTPSQLQVTRPFLMKVIRMVASLRSLRSMLGQRQSIMQYISEAVLIKSERSLDLLQGIVVLLGYYHYHCLVHTQFNNLTQLAISMIGDMGLNRNPMLQERVINPEEPKARTNDERRAIVGVWYMSSNAALTFNKLDPVRYTKYNDQCLTELEEAAEYETDELLVQLIRIQHLTVRIFEINNRDQVVDTLPGIPKTPVAAYHTAFQTELDRLRGSLPSKLGTNYLVTTHYHTAQLRLYEPLLNDTSLLDTVSASFTSLSLSDRSIFDVLYRANAALNIWFENWLAIPVCSYFYMPQPAWGQLIYSITMLSRWVKLSSCKSQPAYISTAQIQVATPTQPSVNFLDPSERRPIGAMQPPNSEPQNPSTLAALRAQVFAQPGLHIDILGILEALVIRFEVSKKEMSAAQGGSWKNDIWDVAARKLKMKRVKLEKWSEIVATVGGEGILLRKYQPADESDGENESGVPAGNETRACFEPPLGNSQDNWQWGSDLFDGMDIDQGFFFDGPSNWSSDWLNDL